MAGNAPNTRSAGTTSPGTPKPRGDSGFFSHLSEEKDDFQLLQKSAGLEQDARHPTGAELEIDDAKKLWEALARSPATLSTFAPRRTLVFLLREVLTAGEDVSYADLLQRTSRFRRLGIMRPDGYLAGALNGQPSQRMGRLELREGRLMAGNFEIGAFCWERGGVFYAVDERLHPLRAASLGELSLEHDWFNAALDGAQDAAEELVVGMAALVTHPIRSAEGLAQLPSAVAALIASSPDYFARYSALPLQEQIREAARLSTHLLTLYGSAAGAAMRMSSVGASLPVLSLTAEGAMVIERVAVPAESVATALGTGTGAVYVLMAAEKAPKEGNSQAAKAPGEWKHKKFSGSERARRYQEQISGRSADEVYFIDGVEYDGFTSGVLKEAKAERYLEFFDESGQPEVWYEKSGGFDGLIEQASKQVRAARGIPLEWHVAERELVEILLDHFQQAGIKGIKVIYTPPIP
ncbi:MAG: Tox-REase-5 domain-containing protein [Hyalangium sp.]|uniref:Tox-REase-5 domain-containing protein n=1 Tax=Hyalangium sp. TaxID=2028555 RepID=UPI0038997F74